MHSLYSVEECEKIAKNASLRYVNDNLPGISREYSNNQFSYFFSKKKITDPELLDYLISLTIPPNWTNVWISPYKNSHILVTARDKNNKKQYRYHPLWVENRQQQKFKLMINFGQFLPHIRKQVDKELKQKIEPSKMQIICAIIYLLDNYHVRIGNSYYAKQNKSYGVTTLRKKHLSLNKNKAFLTFRGKNDKLWELILNDKSILKVLKKCQEIPGHELFKYYKNDNEREIITSQDINHYLQTLTNFPFTAKDFRTWIACREILFKLVNLEIDAQSESHDGLAKTIEEVAAGLGHTPSICIKKYIYPGIITAWKDESLQKWYANIKQQSVKKLPDKLLLHWLEKHFNK